MSRIRPTHDTVGARLARTQNPGSGCCGRCGFPWTIIEAHDTPYTETRGCFPLCEPCWSALTPSQRIPYYETMVHTLWQSNPHRDMDLTLIKASVLLGR